jgi:peroxiredoxin
MSDPIPVDEPAPTFTLPTATDAGIAGTALEEHLADGPVVLAFFPAAFSGTCTTEFCTFRDRLRPLAEAGGSILGISTDLPWALAEFRKQEALPFPLAADNDGAVCADYGVRTDYEPYDIDGVARRAVFVIDGSGSVTYRWLADTPGQEPEYDAVATAVRDA